MATYNDWNLDSKYQNPTEAIPGSTPAIQREDNRNMTMASTMAGWGNGFNMNRFNPAGEIPEGVSVPGMAVPKSYDVAEQAIIGGLNTPPAAIPRGQSDVERAMASTTTGTSPYAGISERASSRLAAVMDRLGGKLRKSTRASLTAEAGTLGNLLTTLTGQETTRATEEARLKEGRFGQAIPGLAALTGARHQAMEEGMSPYEKMAKLYGVRTDEARTGLLNAEQTKTVKESGILPTTIEEAIATHRKLNAPYPALEKPIDEQNIHKAFIDAETKRAAAQSIGTKIVEPDYVKALQNAQTYINGMRRNMQASKPTLEQFRVKAKAANPDYSDEEIDKYYNENYGG